MKHFMIYLPEATNKGEEHLRTLKAVFEDRNVYPLNGSGAFVVKTPDNFSFDDVMDKAGFTPDQKNSGVVIGFDNTNINGWYSRELWKFIGGDDDGRQ